MRTLNGDRFFPGRAGQAGTVSIPERTCVHASLRGSPARAMLSHVRLTPTGRDLSCIPPATDAIACHGRLDGALLCAPFISARSRNSLNGLEPDFSIFSLTLRHILMPFDPNRWKADKLRVNVDDVGLDGGGTR